jgi:hypothetical protein
MLAQSSSWLHGAQRPKFDSSDLFADQAKVLLLT